MCHCIDHRMLLVSSYGAPENGEVATEEEIRDFCRDKIAHFKIPRYIFLVDDFPMTITGKVQKFKMREQTVERLGLNQE